MTGIPLKNDQGYEVFEKCTSFIKKMDLFDYEKLALGKTMGFYI